MEERRRRRSAEKNVEPLRCGSGKERLSIAMALAEKLHHSAQEVVEQHDVSRGQKLASAGEGEEYKKNALYEAPTRTEDSTPLMGMRTMSAAPVPQEVVHDAALVAFSSRKTLSERNRGEEEKEKVKETSSARYALLWPSCVATEAERTGRGQTPPALLFRRGLVRHVGRAVDGDPCTIPRR